MSVFRDLIKDAIDADLGKNAQKVINTLLHQTIGFGKPTDPLTDKRIARISGVRLDRVRLAIHEVMETHIFFRIPHDKFEWDYSIGQKYLDAHQKAFEEKHPEEAKAGKKPPFFTPFLPKNGNNPQKTDPISGNQSHTDLDLNNLLSYLPQLLQLFTRASHPQVAMAGASAMADGDGGVSRVNQDLNQSIRSLSETFKTGLNDLKDTLKPIINLNKQSLRQTPTSANNRPKNAAIFQPSHYQHNLTADSCVGVVCGGEYNKIEKSPQDCAKPKPQTAASNSSQTTAEKRTENQKRADQPILKAVNRAENQNQADQSLNNQNGDTDANDAYPIAIEFPDSLKLYIPNLSQHLQRLQPQQQKEVLYVFKDMQMNGKIKKSPSGLFIYLAKSALEGALNLPEAPIHPAEVKAKAKARNDRFKPEGHPYADDPNIQWGYSPISQPIDENATKYNPDNPYPYTEAEQAAIDALIKQQRRDEQRYFAAQQEKRREAKEAREAQVMFNQQGNKGDSPTITKQTSIDLQVLFAFLELGGTSYQTLLADNDFGYLEDIYADEIAAYRKDLAERRAARQ